MRWYPLLALPECFNDRGHAARHCRSFQRLGVYWGDGHVGVDRTDLRSRRDYFYDEELLLAYQLPHMLSPPTPPGCGSISGGYFRQ